MRNLTAEMRSVVRERWLDIAIVATRMPKAQSFTDALMPGYVVVWAPDGREAATEYISCQSRVVRQSYLWHAKNIAWVGVNGTGGESGLEATAVRDPEAEVYITVAYVTACGLVWSTFFEMNGLTPFTAAERWRRNNNSMPC